MAIFDVTNILTRSTGPYDPYNRNHRSLRLEEVYQWLEENVGEAYGAGNYGTLMIGSGWELYVLNNGKPPKRDNNEFSVVTYHVDITDELKSTLFALKWCK